jgi:hypothetical protein
VCDIRRCVSIGATVVSASSGLAGSYDPTARCRKVCSSIPDKDCPRRQISDGSVLNRPT